ncbi:hypothetical protein B7486_65440, partial [cyanobacterium TDX16]
MALGEEQARWTRDDLVQVEHRLYSLMLRQAEKAAADDPKEVASVHLGVEPSELLELVETIPTIDLEPVQLELRRQVDTLDRAVVTGAGPTQPVIWTSVQLGAERVRVPEYLTMPLQAGPVTPAPLYVRVWPL